MKFKTTLSTPQPSIEHPSTSNNQDEVVSTTGNRRRRGTSSDYATEVTLFNSKSDSWALNLNDETTQTGSVTGGGLIFNGACTDAERQQRIHTSTQDNETTDLLSKFQQGITSNHVQHPPLKPTTSNLVTAAENPWKKLSNVRYKLLCSYNRCFYFIMKRIKNIELILKTKKINLKDITSKRKPFFQSIHVPENIKLRTECF